MQETGISESFRQGIEELLKNNFSLFGIWKTVCGQNLQVGDKEKAKVMGEIDFNPCYGQQGSALAA